MEDASTNGGDASRVGLEIRGKYKRCLIIILLLLFPRRDEAADKIAVYRVKSSFSSLF